METTNAAPTARGYYRRFCLRLKETIHLRDARVDLTLSVIAAIVGRFVWRTEDWLHVIVSCALAFIVFSIGHFLFKVISLWIARDKQLEVLEARVPQLELDIETRKQKRFQEIQDDADFLWITRTEDDLSLWKLNQQRWVMYAPSVVADYCAIDRETATKRLFDCSGMDSYETKAVLQRHIANLKTIAALRGT